MANSRMATFSFLRNEQILGAQYVSNIRKQWVQEKKSTHYRKMFVKSFMPFFFFKFLDYLDPFRIQEDYPSGKRDYSETTVTRSGNPGGNISLMRSPRSCPVGGLGVPTHKHERT